MMRWATIVLLVGSLVAAVAYDRVDIAPEPEEPTPPTAFPTPARAEPRPLSQTWMCPLAASSAVTDGFLVLTNVGAEPAHVSVSVYATDGAGPTLQSEVAPLDVELIPVSELTDATETSLGVEAQGDVVVSHRLTVGDQVIDNVCSTDTSETWHFAGGATTRDRTELLVVTNPYPTDVVFSLRFRTEARDREPADLEATTVGARSMRIYDITDAVTREATVAATLQTISGEVVVERLTVANGDLGPVGADLELGAPGARTRWFLPAGRLDSYGQQQVVIRNPTEVQAEVDVELWPIDNETRAAQGLTAIPVTIRPGSVEVLDLTELSESFGWPDPFNVGVSVVADNVAAVVAERRTLRPSIDTSLIGAGGTEASADDTPEDDTSAEETTADETDGADGAEVDGAEADGAEVDEAAEGSESDTGADEAPAEGEAPPQSEPSGPTSGTTGLGLSRGSAAPSTMWVGPALGIGGGILRVDVMAPEPATVSARVVVAGLSGPLQELTLDTSTDGSLDFGDLSGEAVLILESTAPVVAELTVIDGDRMRTVPMVPLLAR